jgi:hypothetical protein
VPQPADWLRLARLARVLSWITLAWMGIEGGVAIGAALLAGSAALLGFGLDSGIEAMASFIVIWRFTGDTPGQSHLRTPRPAACGDQLLPARALHMDRLPDQRCMTRH